MKIYTLSCAHMTLEVGISSVLFDVTTQVLGIR